MPTAQVVGRPAIRSGQMFLGRPTCVGRWFDRRILASSRSHRWQARAPPVQGSRGSRPTRTLPVPPVGLPPRPVPPVPGARRRRRGSKAAQTPFMHLHSTFPFEQVAFGTGHGLPSRQASETNPRWTCHRSECPRSSCRPRTLHPARCRPAPGTAARAFRGTDSWSCRRTRRCMLTQATQADRSNVRTALIPSGQR